MLVNPYDQSAMEAAIGVALAMPAPERRQAMIAMRRRVMNEDVHWWLGWFLAAAHVDPVKVRRERRAARPA
jgi:trehalose-6-phosphate synthase